MVLYTVGLKSSRWESYAVYGQYSRTLRRLAGVGNIGCSWVVPSGMTQQLRLRMLLWDWKPPLACVASLYAWHGSSITYYEYYRYCLYVYPSHHYIIFRYDSLVLSRGCMYDVYVYM